MLRLLEIEYGDTHGRNFCWKEEIFWRSMARRWLACDGWKISFHLRHFRSADLKPDLPQTRSADPRILKYAMGYALFELEPEVCSVARGSTTIAEFQPTVCDLAADHTDPMVAIKPSETIKVSCENIHQYYMYSFNRSLMPMPQTVLERLAPRTMFNREIQYRIGWFGVWSPAHPIKVEAWWGVPWYAEIEL